MRNRNGRATNLKRRFDKLCGSRAWYIMENEEEIRGTEALGYRYTRRRNQKNGQKVESVFFIHLTPEGALKRRLQDMESNSSFSTRFRCRYSRKKPNRKFGGL